MELKFRLKIERKSELKIEFEIEFTKLQIKTLNKQITRASVDNVTFASLTTNVWLEKKLKHINWRNIYQYN